MSGRVQGGFEEGRSEQAAHTSQTTFRNAARKLHRRRHKAFWGILLLSVAAVLCRLSVLSTASVVWANSGKQQERQLIEFFSDRHWTRTDGLVSVYSQRGAVLRRHLAFRRLPYSVL